MKSRYCHPPCKCSKQNQKTDPDYNIPAGTTISVGNLNNSIININGNSPNSYGAGGGILIETKNANNSIVNVTNGGFTLQQNANSTTINLNNATFDMSTGQNLNNGTINYSTGVSNAILSSSVSKDKSFSSISFQNFDYQDFITTSDGVINITNLSYNAPNLSFTGQINGKNTNYSINITLASDVTTPSFASQNISSTSAQIMLQQVGGSISGNVSLVVGMGGSTPIQGASVQLNTEEKEEGKSPINEFTSTDQNGNYSFTGLDPNTYKITFSDGYQAVVGSLGGTANGNMVSNIPVDNDNGTGYNGISNM